MKRVGQVIKLKPEKLAYYKELHANCWPGVKTMIKKCNIQNFSIFYRDGYMFSYFEYTGDDFKADMARMYDDPETQRWLKETDPCQQPIKTAEPGEWWAAMEELFYLN